MNLGNLGKKGEDMVAAFLQKKGYFVIKRNYISRFGEIDIIAQKGNLLLFIEVKTRQKGAFLSPRESVDYYKINRITLTAKDYLSKSPASYDLQPRFDVAEVTVDDDGKFSLNYIKNAF